MVRRLSLLLRGPGILALVIGLAAIGTASAKYHWLRGSGHRVVRLAPRYTVIIAATGVVYDAATGMNAQLVAASAARPKPAGSGLLLLATIRLYNSGKKAAFYSQRNFYGIEPSGTTMAAELPSNPKYGERSFPGVLRPGSSPLPFTIQFTFPSVPPPVTIIWNDNNHLLTPATLGTVTVRSAGSR